MIRPSAASPLQIAAAAFDDDDNDHRELSDSIPLAAQAALLEAAHARVTRRTKFLPQFKKICNTPEAYHPQATEVGSATYAQ